METANLTLTGVGPNPKEIVLEAEILVGRSASSDVQIDGDLVSRRHARIYREGTRWHVEDLGSRNGTLLNGVRTMASELKSGDVIMIGYGKLLFEEEGSESESTVQVSLTDEAEPADATFAIREDLPSAEETGATVALSYRDLVEVNQRISTIVRVSQKLAGILARTELLSETMDALFEVFRQADRGAVVLSDEDGAFRVAASKTSEDATFATTSVISISTGLIELVRREGKAVLSKDLGKDSRFANRPSLITSSLERSVMCAPLLRDQEFLGVVYLDTSSLNQPFNSNDLMLLQGIAAPVAICLKNSQLVARIEHETQLRTSLSRYLSPDVVDRIGEGAISANLGGEMAEGTVLFSDIVGFTAMAEKLEPTEVVARLNRYFESMLQVIFGWKGTIDKLGGDAILAVWGAPVATDEHAVRAVAGALEMQARLFELNLALEEAGELRIRMAVGLNSGHFVAGNIGGEEHMEWTVIGDCVNLAQRVESHAFRGSVLVSESTFEALAGAGGAYKFKPVQVKGRVDPVTIYSVRALETHRGIVCALPGALKMGDDILRAMVVKGHVVGSKQRLTICVQGNPKVGAKVQFLADSKERPGVVTLSGRVVSSNPLRHRVAGRTVDVVAEEGHEDLALVLRAGGVAEATKTLEEIER